MPCQSQTLIYQLKILQKTKIQTLNHQKILYNRSRFRKIREKSNKLSLKGLLMKKVLIILTIAEIEPPQTNLICFRLEKEFIKTLNKLKQVQRRKMQCFKIFKMKAVLTIPLIRIIAKFYLLNFRHNHDLNSNFISYILFALSVI